jgi:hypothetical protein
LLLQARPVVASTIDTGIGVRPARRGRGEGHERRIGKERRRLRQVSNPARTHNARTMKCGMFTLNIRQKETGHGKQLQRIVLLRSGPVHDDWRASRNGLLPL